MAWRVAESLIKLRQQLNTAYPNRNKASDGTIGDPNHQAEGTGSDHNPNKAGVVCAYDITHDPANGVDIAQLSQQLADSRDPRIKYLIRNKQILVPADYGWKWVVYTGSNPHTSHLHVSVYGNYDDETNWNIGEDMGRIQELEDMANNRQKMLNDIAALYSIPAPLDGNSLPLLFNNIRTEKDRIDELTKIVSERENKGTSNTQAPLSKESVIKYIQDNLK